MAQPSGERRHAQGAQRQLAAAAARFAAATSVRPPTLRTRNSLACVSPPLPIPYFAKLSYPTTFMKVPALIDFLHSSVTENCTGPPQPQVVFVSDAAALASATGGSLSVTQQQSDPCADCALDERLTSVRGCAACSGRCKVGATAGRPQPICLRPCTPSWRPGRPSPSPASCRASPEVRGSLSQVGRRLY